MASCHTHATLLGVSAVSAAPTEHSCTNINYPTEFTDFTEFSGCVYSPTDCTDVHRLGGYGILPYPRSNQTIFPQNPTQPNHLWASVKSVGGSSLPEASVSSVNSVGEPYAAKPSVSICEICGRIIKWAAWVWQGCHTLLSVLCWRTSPGGKTQRGHGGMPCPLTLVMWMRGGRVKTPNINN